MCPASIATCRRRSRSRRSCRSSPLLTARRWRPHTWPPCGWRSGSWRSGWPPAGPRSTASRSTRPVSLRWRASPTTPAGQAPKSPPRPTVRPIRNCTATCSCSTWPGASPDPGRDGSWRWTPGRSSSSAPPPRRSTLVSWPRSSSGHRHIDQLAARFQAENGRPPTKLERRRLAQRDRLAKTPACRVPHWPAYRRVLDRHGLAPPTPERMLVDAPAPLREREATVRARLLGADGLTKHEASFDEATVTRMVFQASTGLLTTEQAAGFLERFLAGPDLVPVVVDGQPRLTTTVLVQQEQTIVTIARQKTQQPVPAPTTVAVE